MTQRTGRAECTSGREEAGRAGGVQLEDLRRRIMPFAEAQGYLTDEDVFRERLVRVFLDTDVLVSAVATRGLCADVLQAVLAEHHLVLGETVRDELQRVLRTKIRGPAEIAVEIDAWLRREATVIRDAPRLRLELRDADDARVLEEAVAGGADLLVTGDGDLLEIAEEAPLPIAGPRGFWERLRSRPRSR